MDDNVQFVHDIIAKDADITWDA